MQETEQQLLDAIRGGDHEALRRLYDRYSDYAMAIGLRYVYNREDARDVVQDCFIKILTSISSFEYRGEGSLKAWIATIVINRSVDWVKLHEKIQVMGSVPDIADEEPPDIERVPPDILIKMIGRLPAGCRLVLNLHVFERLTHSEIAHRLGIKESSSASQFSRARVQLKEMIDEYLNSQGR